MKYRLKSSLFAGFSALLLLFPNVKESTLNDITKPYLGEYECKSATLGETDYTEDFSYIKLELKADETFSLHYCPKDGNKRTETGKYSYDKEKSVLRFQSETGDVEKEFPIKDGVILIQLRLGNKILVMKFER